MATGWPMKTTYANGDVYSASDVNDITGTINLLGSSVAYTAGKNKIINGDFGIWQRGTTAFTVDGVYTSDRWSWNQGSTTGAQVTQGTFTPAELTVPYGNTNFYVNVAGTMTNSSLGYIQVQQRIEDVRTLQNTTATFSFYAKGSASGTINIVLRQNFGSGGSAAVLTTPINFNITTSWARYSTTVSIPSVSGKTIGSSSYLEVIIVKNMGSSYPTFGTSNYTGTLSIWGVQLEQGSTATAFQTATGTIQGELAACQRYYYRMTPLTSGDSFYGTGFAASATSGLFVVTFPVTMRKQPTALEQSGTAADYRIRYAGGTTSCSSVPTFDAAEPFTAFVVFTVPSGLTTGQAIVGRSGNTSGYLGWSAEL